MKVTEVVVSRDVKRNLGNYESTDVFCSMKLELESFDTENFEDSDIHELQARVNGMVLDELEKIVHSKSPDTSRDQIAKRYGL